MIRGPLLWWERLLDLLAIHVGGRAGYRLTVWLLERAERRARCPQCGSVA